MSTLSFQLNLDIRSYWRAGSGDGGGAYADLLVIKKQGLPYLPGKQLKGLLKNAMTTCVQAQVNSNPKIIPKTIIDELFGQEGATSKGLIEISNATLPVIEKQWLLEDKGRIKMLYHTKDSQAVDYATGTTKPGSLRTMEVAVPMQLCAEINLTSAINGYNIEQIKKWMEYSCQLITHIGANRNRGLGRVNITLVETTMEVQS